MTGRTPAPLTRRKALGLSLAVSGVTAAAARRWRAEEIRRFSAPEAHQAVAVDAEHFYAIGNHVIAQYDKKSGRRLAGWQCERGKPLIHLNSGVVREGWLYCAHSNYPEVPMASSVEIWETKGLRHAKTHSFGIFAGSATWLDSREGHWYVTFGHYGNRAGEANRDPRWTTLIQFDSSWRRLQAWVYPEQVLSRLGDYTISGGIFGPDNTIFCTGHDHPEIYVLRFPEGGSNLVLKDTFVTPSKGQGIAWDPSQAGILYSIDRATREVIVTRVFTDG
jgi:hypothetical protein